MRLLIALYFVLSAGMALADPTPPPEGHVVDHFGIKHGLGLVHRFGEAKLPREYESLKSITALPASYDAREKGYVSAVKDQGQCGSCWAHAITENLEDLYLRLGKGTTQLSPQQMVDCDRQAYGCSGGSMYDAAYPEGGIAAESAYPYHASNGWCKNPLPAPAAKAAAWGFVGAQGRAPTTDEIKAALLVHGTLFVTVSAGGWNWQGNPDMSHCGNYGTNHMVEIVGWTADSKWIMRNSWGTGWGDKGFGYMPFGCDEIASTPDSAGFLKYYAPRVKP